MIRRAAAYSVMGFILCACAITHAEDKPLDFSEIFSDIQSPYDFTGSKMGYGARRVEGSEGGNKVVFGPTSDATELHLAFNSQVTDDLILRSYVKIDPREGDLSTIDANAAIGQDLFFEASQYGIYALMPKRGVFYIGRLETPTGVLSKQTALSSGVNEQYFVDVGGVVVLNTLDDQDYRVGVVQVGDDTSAIMGGKGVSLWGYGPAGGNRVLDSIGYIYPMQNGELRLAYSNQDQDNQKHSFEATVTYLFDWVVAQSKFMLGYASSWPYASKMDMMYQNDVDGLESVWVEPGYQSPYQLAQFANKLSAGDIDISVSYARIFGNTGDDAIDTLPEYTEQLMFAADYNFIDLLSYGPLSLGLGYVQRNYGFNKVESIVLEGEMEPFFPLLDQAIQQGYAFSGVDKVEDGENHGFILSLHQRFGPKAGMKCTFENLNFDGKVVENSMKKAAQDYKDSKGAGFSSLSIEEKVAINQIISLPSSYDLDITPINAFLLSFYVKF